MSECSKNKLEERIFYVYIYVDPRNNSPFYVGKGTGKRAYRHITASKNIAYNSVKLNKIRKIIRETGQDPEIIFFKTDLLEDEAFSLEMALIKCWGRRDIKTGCLANLTNGGDGPSNLSEETRKQISESHLGKKASDETRKKQSDALKGQKRSEEFCKRNSERQKGIPKSEKARQHMSEARLGKKASDETRKKQSEALMGHEVKEETRKQISKTLMGHKVTEESRKKMSESTTGKPGFWTGKHRSEKTKKQISKKLKLRNAKKKLKEILEREKN